MIRIGSIVIRVDDIERQTAFWSAALGYEPRKGGSDDFVLLKPRDGVGPNVSLDRVRSTVQVPPRIHLDLYTEDQAGEVARLLGSVPPRSSGPSARRTPTTSSWPTRKATASAWWTSRADRPGCLGPCQAPWSVVGLAVRRRRSTAASPASAIPARNTCQG